MAADVQSIDNGTATEESILLNAKQNPVNTTPIYQQMVTLLYTEYLGHTPVQNAALDQVTPNVTMLMKGKPVKGKLTPYEQIIVNLLSSADYLALKGDTNNGWVQAFNDELSTAGSTIQGASNALILSLYATQRANVVTAITGSKQYRNQVYTQYYEKYFSTPSAPYTPTTTDLQNAENVYQANGKRLEAVLASILSQSGFEPLSGSSSSSNATWLSAVYNDLLAEALPNNATTTQQMNQLKQRPYARSDRRRPPLDRACHLEFRSIPRESDRWVLQPVSPQQPADDGHPEHPCVSAGAFVLDPVHLQHRDQPECEVGEQSRGADDGGKW